MKKKIYTFWLVFAIAITQTWNVSAQTLTLNIGSSTLWTDSVTAPSNSCRTGGFWSDTYGNTTGFQIGSFKFTHNSGFDIYSYWGGFTTGANGNSRCYCSNCYNASCTGCPNYCTVDSLSGSWGWIHNQWGVMAGGGLSSTSPITVTKGVPYLIGYWDYFSETGGTRSLEIKLNGDSLFTPQEIYICNHPWPYYGNIYGDGFARPLNQTGDYFKLWIHAIHANYSHDSISVNLAINNGTLSQSSNWQQVSLTSFRTNVKSLYFTMETTDAGEWGPNTALYFCLDKLKVRKTGSVATSSSAKVKSAATTFRYEVADKMKLNSYTGGAVTVYDAKGKEVLETSIKAGGDSIDLSKLPAGEYRVRHGHKAIPIKKIK